MTTIWSNGLTKHTKHTIVVWVAIILSGVVVKRSVIHPSRGHGERHVGCAPRLDQRAQVAVPHEHPHGGRYPMAILFLGEN